MCAFIPPIGRLAIRSSVRTVNTAVVVGNFCRVASPCSEYALKHSNSGAIFILPNQCRDAWAEYSNKVLKTAKCQTFLKHFESMYEKVTGSVFYMFDLASNSLLAHNVYFVPPKQGTRASGIC